MMWTVIYHNQDAGFSTLELNGPMDAEGACKLAQEKIEGDIVVMVKGLHKVWEPEQGWLNDNTPQCRTNAQLYDLYSS
jgi:hypothetical protein